VNEIIGFDDDVMILEVGVQASCCMHEGYRQLFHHLVSGFWIFQGSANEVYEMLSSSDILN